MFEVAKGKAKQAAGAVSENESPTTERPLEEAQAHYRNAADTVEAGADVQALQALAGGAEATQRRPSPSARFRRRDWRRRWPQTTQENKPQPPKRSARNSRRSAQRGGRMPMSVGPSLRRSRTSSRP
jgi:hypothetical protein